MPTAFPPRAELFPAGTLPPATFKVKLAAFFDAVVALLGTDGEPATARGLLGVAPRATRIDVASVAGTVDLTTTAPNSDDIRITGALAITAFTVAAGRVVRFVAAGAASLANNSNIVTNTGATVTFAAGDSGVLRATAADVVELISFTRAVGGRAFVQEQSSFTGAYATGPNLIPFDDTIPQITEGDQYLAVAITPQNAGSEIEIEVTFCGAHSVNTNLTVALFQSGVSNALAAVDQNSPGGMIVFSFKHKIAAGSTSARTYSVRAGGANAGTTYFNGNGGTRYLGGVMASSITVKEILP
jgi:hypothetical protein